MLSDREALFEMYTMESEMALCIFLVWYELLDLVVSVRYLNWRIRPCCFFLYLLRNVRTVAIENDPCTLHTVIDILYPFLLPPMVQHLTLLRCRLLEHSIEGLLSPSTTLISLVVSSVQHSYMVCCTICDMCLCL